MNIRFIGSENGLNVLPQKALATIMTSIGFPAQCKTINKKKLSTPRGKYIIYSKDFGSNVYVLNGQTKNIMEMYIEDFLIQSLVDNKYTLSITNIEIEREEQGYYTVSFLVNTIYGQYNENTQIEAII